MECTQYLLLYMTLYDVPLSSPPMAIPLRNMNTPSIATWTERGTTTVAECRERRRGSGKLINLLRTSFLKVHFRSAIKLAITMA